MDNDTLFSKIIRGDIPCHKLYEDERTFVFLDIFPVVPAHTIVIPKNPTEFVWDLPDEDYATLRTTAKLMALRLREVMGVTYVAERIIGVDVPHAHIHLLPFNNSAELLTLQNKEHPADDTELARLAKVLAF